jgi:hypothetical protein
MGLNRRARTTAKKMGLSMGAPTRIPTSTTTVAARPSITRKKEGWRSALVTVSVMPACPFAGSFAGSFIT